LFVPLLVVLVISLASLPGTVGPEGVNAAIVTEGGKGMRKREYKLSPRRKAKGVTVTIKNGRGPKSSKNRFPDVK
jgi:hypothetical protein